MSVCLDTFALLAWVLDEPSAGTTEDQLSRAAVEENQHCLMAAMNLGELFYIVARRLGVEEAENLWRRCTRGEIPLTIVEATLARVRAAATLKAQHPISYADAFAVATAVEHRVPLLTGDPEILALQNVPGLKLVDLTPS